MHILVTRPLPEGWETRAQIERLGHTVSLAPLLDITFEELTAETFDGASGVIVTSRNGLRGLSFSGLLDRARHLQIYAVGDATADLAHQLKLLNITAGRGTAADLVSVIAERQAGRPGRLLHLAGDHQAFDLSGALAAKGCKVETVVVYRQIAAASLPPPIIADVKAGRFDAVTLFSARTAEIWSELAQKHQLTAQAQNLIHLCLSEAVAAKIRLGEARIELAAEPRAEEMLALIKGLAAPFAQE